MGDSLCSNASFDLLRFLVLFLIALLTLFNAVNISELHVQFDLLDTVNDHGTGLLDIRQNGLQEVRRLLEALKPALEIGTALLLRLLAETIAFGQQRAAQLRNKLLPGILWRAEDILNLTIKTILCSRRMHHLMECGPIIRLARSELLLLRRYNHVLGRTVIRIILMLRHNGTYPLVIADHRIDSREGKELPFCPLRLLDGICIHKLLIKLGA